VADEVRSANPEFLVDVQTQGNLDGDWDSERVEQLLSNLLTNAVQHGAEKNVGLSVKGEEDLVLLEVHKRSTNTKRTSGDDVRSARSRQKLNSEPNGVGAGPLHRQRDRFSTQRNGFGDLVRRFGNDILGKPTSSLDALNNKPRLCFQIRRTGDTGNRRSRFLGVSMKFPDLIPPRGIDLLP